MSVHQIGRTRLPVVEVFGPVWQGEGPHAGRRCSFLRLDLCNLACEWCDTPYSWQDGRDPAALLDAADILDLLDAHHTDLLVVTGGEPLIHAANTTLRDVLYGWAGSVDVETNGTLPPPDWWSRVGLFNVSPKLWTGGPMRKRIKPDVLAAWAALPNAIFKVVCSTPEQVAEVAVQPWAADPGRVWIMPEGRSITEVLSHAAVVEEATARAGFNLTLRQQTLMHGDERGH